MAIRMFVHLMLFLVLAATCAGQQSKGNETSSGSSGLTMGQAKKEIVTVAEPPTSYREVGQAQVSYFSGSDTTEVRTEWSVHQSHGLSASMWLVFTIKGRSLIRPKVVSVNIGLSAEKERLENLAGFALEVDDKSLNLDGPTVGNLEYDLNAKRFLKAMHGSIAWATFENLADSRTVKVHVGDIVFELSKSNRNALRDMLRAIQ